MCQNCFEKEISDFPTWNDWLKFDMVLTEKLSSGEMKSLNLYYRDEYRGAYIYQCVSCGQRWKCQDPDNSIRGYFKKVEPVFYNNIGISDWNEYITTKFADSSLFEIQKPEIISDWTVKSNWTVRSKTNRTSIRFIGLSEDNTLHCCEYANEACKGVGNVGVREWIDQTGSQTAMFTQANINILDRELDNPIYKGWFSVDYYLFGKFYNATTYTDKSKNAVLGVDVNNRFACLELILFPIFLPVRWLIKAGIIGKRREIHIEPIGPVTDIVFPSLSENQVALLRADYSTGQVLNSNFELHINTKKEEVYTVFTTLDSAKQYVEEQKAKGKNAEFWIYGQDRQEVGDLEKAVILKKLE